MWKSSSNNGGWWKPQINIVIYFYNNYYSIQFDPAPRQENESTPKRVPDYFLWGLQKKNIKINAFNIKLNSRYLTIALKTYLSY